MRRLLSGQRQIERLATLEEKVVKFGRAQREQLARQDARLDALRDTVAERASASAIRALGRRVEDVQESLVQLDRTFAEALERARLLDQQAGEDRRFARRIESMLRHRHPIIVGPWTGEVGFELLYWIPFVRWVAQTYHVPPDRLFVVSRGGVERWYAGLATSYADAFTFYPPDEFRIATEAAKKQRGVRAFDVDVVDRVMAAHQLRRASLLHPGMMYRLFMPFWKELAPVTRIERYATHARIEAESDPVLRELPADYIAARFYFSDCFPDTPSNRELVSSILETISRERPVVLLNTPFAVDDHRDAAAARGRVVTIGSAHMVPERNLAVQTAVIAGARSFVGTYGGYSYLAPLCGVPSLAFYSQRSFQVSHLDVARRVFERLGDAPLIPLDVNDLPMLRLALPGLPLTT
jgi:hypothetical protein